MISNMSWTWYSAFFWYGLRGDSPRLGQDETAPSGGLILDPRRNFPVGIIYTWDDVVGIWWTFAFIGLVNFWVSAWVGARLYSEDAAA